MSGEWYHFIYNNVYGIRASVLRLTNTKYITGITKNKGQKLLAVGGMPDHVHVFIGDMTPEVRITPVRQEQTKEPARGSFS